MFRNSHEGDGSFTHDHFLALRGGDLTRGHLEDLRNMNYFPLFNLKVIEHVPRSETHALIVVNREAGIR